MIISEKNQTSSLPVLSVLLTLGLMAAAFILGVQFKNLRQPGMVTARGLAEKDFKSDNVTWNTGVEAHVGSYQGMLDLLNARRKKLFKSLQEQGSETAEMQIGLPSVERIYNEARDEQRNVTRALSGYGNSLDITVNAKKLDRVQAVQQAILSLRAQNKFIRFSSPQYLLDNLENVKRDLITQATEDTQKRAIEFARTGDGKVGVVRSASQGPFNIYADNGSSEDDGYGGSYGKTTVDKQVRLVVTVEYSIE